MIDPDFLRLVRLGAIELELQRLERGECSAVPSPDGPVRAPSLTEIAMRTCLLANVGERVLREHEPRHHKPEVGR